MNTYDSKNTMLRLQTIISECRRAQTASTPAHSIGKPDISSMITNINVRFAAMASLPLKIKHLEKGKSL
jgi:hypothetical protein